MNRLLCCFASVLLSMAWSPSGAASDTDWLQEQMTAAMGTAAPWKLARLEIVITDSQHLEVSGDGRIFIGSPLIDRLRQLEDGARLTRFLLLHEIRHVVQKNLRREASMRELECDSDYFAVLLLAREGLSASTKETRNADLSRILASQGIAARAGSLALTSSLDGHLAAKERFAAGAFATWRALYEFLTSQDIASLKQYNEVRNRAKGFVEPESLDVDAWIQDFCRAVTQPSNGLSSLYILAQKDVVTDTSDNVVYFNNKVDVENKSDRAIRLRAWPMLGLRNIQQPRNFENAAAISAGYLDLTIPPAGKAQASYRSYYARKVPTGMQIFAWESPYQDGFIAIADAIGGRQEPGNCTRGWAMPQAAESARLYQFILRAGAVAARDFEGMVGQHMFSNMAPAFQRQYYLWASPPASVSQAESYIFLKKGSTSGLLSLIKTGDFGKAKAKFAEHVQIIRSACAVNGQVLRERSTSDGGSELSVDYLTLSSEASLYLSVGRDPKQPEKPPTYSVSWVIRPKD